MVRAMQDNKGLVSKVSVGGIKEAGAHSGKVGKGKGVEWAPVND